MILIRSIIILSLYFDPVKPPPIAEVAISENREAMMIDIIPRKSVSLYETDLSNVINETHLP